MTDLKRDISWHDMAEDAYRASRLIKALGNPKTFALCVELARRGESRVEDLQGILDRGQSAVSRMLRALRDLNVVRYQKVGKETWYTLKHPAGLQRILSATISYVHECEAEMARERTRSHPPY